MTKIHLPPFAQVAKDLNSPCMQEVAKWPITLIMPSGEKVQVGAQTPKAVVP
jgi:hypothetical protein